MESGLHFMVVLCLTSGLWTGANAENKTASDDWPKLCPPGWTESDQKCYIFHSSKMDWADAERFCTSIGGNLASLQTTEEYESIRGVIQQVTGTDTNIWVGGYDATKDGVWLWSDGSKFDFTGWGKVEPNGRAKENCMEINFNGQDYVNDTICSLKKSFFCSKPL
ncbi:galactose-specific lectin nattectin-like [Sander lucioperca]|uniref:galactose-specific lectin nattectin-like n=1 Tax=Sander lucioperca TaxID=283035 RepID=UPI001653CA4F|nr:galactose-specific lectin nattectin-like [Sander lucioperca]